MTSRELGPVRIAVADLAFGDPVVAARAAQALDRGGDEAWEAAIKLAIGWGVLPSVRAHLDEERLAAPLRAQLRSAGIAVALRSTIVVHESIAALRILQAATIETVVIKGVGLIAALRLNPARRTTSDLDLVVRERDAERARAALMEAGFAEINPEFERHMSDIALSTELHNFARALRRNDFEVDLHWRFGPKPPQALEAERLVSRAMEATLAGRRVRVADPIDGVLINVHHALRGGFIPHNTVRDLCDLKTWWDAGTVAERLDELIAMSRASALGPSLSALWAAILQRDPGHALRAGYDRLQQALDRTERRDAELLERYFEDHLLRGGAAHFTVEVFAPRVYLRSIAGKMLRSLRGNVGSDAPATGEIAPRGPLLVRVLRLGPRIGRVFREMSRLRNIPSYRALARAQSRFH
jgi:hypothetical protein